MFLTLESTKIRGCNLKLVEKDSEVEIDDDVQDSEHNHDAVQESFYVATSSVVVSVSSSRNYNGLSIS